MFTCYNSHSVALAIRYCWLSETFCSCKVYSDFFLSSGICRVYWVYWKQSVLLFNGLHTSMKIQASSSSSARGRYLHFTQSIRKHLLKFELSVEKALLVFGFWIKLFKKSEAGYYWYKLMLKRSSSVHSKSWIQKTTLLARLKISLLAYVWS